MATSRGPIRRRMSSTSGGWEGDLARDLARFGEAIINEANRPAARAGALVFYHEMRKLVPIGVEGDGSSNDAPGTLHDSIYHAYSKEESTNGRQVYHIGPNKRKAPHWHFTEFGHERVNEIVLVDGKWRATTKRLASPVWVPPTPWITPTYEGKVHTAVEAMRERMREKIREIQGRST